MNEQKLEQKTASQLKLLLCANLKSWRTGLKLNQSIVADVIGIPRSSYVQIEQGNRHLYAHELYRLSEVFQIDLLKIFKFDT